MPDNKNYKIIMVDDDKFLLSMYESKFKRYGHEVLSINSGSGAIDKIKEGFIPDIIILDIIMPPPDGLQTLEIIRKENLAPDAVVIMLTNQGDSKEIEKAKSLNIDGYIVKAALIPSEVALEVIKIAESKKS